MGAGATSESDREAVLFANEAFYAAFAGGDAAAMMSVWAQDASVTCIHPGWAALTTVREIQKSWERILDSPPPIRCLAPTVALYGDLAMVLCFEEISGAYLLATNVFLRRGSAWRMVHHHAGVTNAHPPQRPDEPMPSIN